MCVAHQDDDNEKQRQISDTLVKKQMKMKESLQKKGKKII